MLEHLRREAHDLHEVAVAQLARDGALDADAEDLARARVVGDLEARLVLDHRARSRISTSRQRFVRDIGRHSTTRTRSPSWAALRSSWACSVLEVRTILRYRRWRLATSMRTVIVL